MTDRKPRADAFRALHVRGDPLLLFNAWDAGSAAAIARAGAKAIATGSWSVAGAHGFADGEAMPFDLAIANLKRIVDSVDLPVSVDLEAGYGDAPEDVARSVAAAAAAGAIGCNLEDGIPAGGFYETPKQAERLAVARDADPLMFLNARIDIFLRADPASHAGLMEGALARAAAYADAGVDGIFLPGLADEALIARAAKAIALPLNIMAMPSTPALARLAELGVARVSHGPGPWRMAMDAVEHAARAAMG
ncbi:isocitrate lyase/PEP mutase family protein [Allosphingosinicella indica]|uniref:2-Methylisocitrate lyase, PEP mutase family n=1 Tax=Allosphingosinicella indica TaxID=941907 RepID=A0A1X7FZQ2_9SPHN|nr:isocitrate lyase/phosphoenolpyruvate mutase family protein [Allosphingosinicella indica]SMF61571.1 2-Methylisocitrate lyase, PEP mutase family [Allosphingosinicella indica]